MNENPVTTQADRERTPVVIEEPAPPKRGSSQRRLPSLDGLRALSIMVVFLAHACGTRGFVSTRFLLFDYGRFGVRIFFVISGFLITSLLIDERTVHGKVSLRLFYARRSVRIFPAAYCCIAVIAIFSLFGGYHLSSADIWRAATYTTNLWPASMRAWQLGHLWSLSVEEQFYLIWPLLFVIAGPKKTTWAALGMILFGVTFRLVDRLFFFHTIIHQIDGDWFPYLADSLAAGCLIASSGNYLLRQRWYRQLLRPRWSLMILAGILILALYEERTALIWVFGTVLMNVAIAFLVHRSIVAHMDPVGRLLNWSPLRFIGVLSYSLYLWQQPFLNRYSLSWFCAFPENVLLPIGAALMSYYFIEKPFLNLRRRLRAKSTA